MSTTREEMEIASVMTTMVAITGVRKTRFKSWSASGHNGVYYNGKMSRPWRATFQLGVDDPKAEAAARARCSLGRFKNKIVRGRSNNKVRVEVGRFATKQEAIDAYRAKWLEIHGYPYVQWGSTGCTRGKSNDKRSTDHALARALRAAQAAIRDLRWMIEEAMREIRKREEEEREAEHERVREAMERSMRALEEGVGDVCDVYMI